MNIIMTEAASVTGLEMVKYSAFDSLPFLAAAAAAQTHSN